MSEVEIGVKVCFSIHCINKMVGLTHYSLPLVQIHTHTHQMYIYISGVFWTAGRRSHMAFTEQCPIHYKYPCNEYQSEWGPVAQYV